MNLEGLELKPDLFHWIEVLFRSKVVRAGEKGQYLSSGMSFLLTAMDLAHKI